MKITILKPTIITEEEAVKKFWSKKTKIPYSIELIYFPFLLFRYHVNQIYFSGKNRSYDGLLLTDLIKGIPINVSNKIRFKMNPEFQKKFKDLIDPFFNENDGYDILFIKEDKVDEEKVLPILLAEDEAIKRGIKILMYDIMKFTGSIRHRKVDIEPRHRGKVIYHPYWLIYYLNRKNEMKFSVLDAMNGQIEGREINDAIQIGLFARATHELERNHP